ncbi:MAG: hypothetical protein LAT55_00640 [Opitutales bacterium]|nr:hypothetical protein [Opitutales bacterium]
MDPSTLIASASLASKIVPQALNSLGAAFAPDRAEKNLPTEAISFDRALQMEALRANTVVTRGDEIANLLKALPELNFESGQEDWSGLAFEVSDRGDLTLRFPDQSSRQVALTRESRAHLVEIFDQVKESDPPHSPLGTAVHLTIAAAPEAQGSALSGRAFGWKTV